jgi:general secretion pathway protein C
MLDQIGLVARENVYRVSEQHDSGVTLAGIRTGDLVRTVNGQPVGNVDRDRRLFDAVAATGLARLEIERDGETIVMSFPLE